MSKEIWHDSTRQDHPTVTVLASLLTLIAVCGSVQPMSAEIAGVWAVGERGTIIHCSDFNGPWTLQNSGTTNDLTDVFFLNAREGWAAGNGGTLLHTTNGGSTWVSRSTGSSGNFRSVHFSDPQHGWVVADSQTCLQTSNGGATWNPVDIRALALGGFSSAVGIHFLDAQHGWLALFGKPLWETIDGGATWTQHGSARLFQQLEVVDSQHIWAAGGGLVYTKDGGTTWQTAGGAANMVDFVDTSCGWTDGPGWWNVSRTLDGGQTWTTQNTGTFLSITAIQFADRDHGWAFALNGGIRHTANGGADFAAQASPTGNTIRAATVVVPEPSTLTLLAAGVMGFGWCLRRGRNECLSIRNAL